MARLLPCNSLGIQLRDPAPHPDVRCLRIADIYRLSMSGSVQAFPRGFGTFSYFVLPSWSALSIPALMKKTKTG